MIPTISGLGKREGEPLLAEEQLPLKKFKKEDKREEEIFSIDRLPDECLERISFFLPHPKDLFIFERLFKRAMRYTAPGWERLAKQERLDFNWSLSDFDRKWYPQKARYLHGKVLSVYITARETLLTRNQPPQAQNGNFSREEFNELFSRFEGVMGRYSSSLGAFIWKDLNCLGKVYSSSQSFPENVSVDPQTPLPAGDLLLKGLSYLSSHHRLQNDSIKNVFEKQELRCLSFELLSEAILQGASCASCLAIQMLFSKFSMSSWYFNLTVFSITKQDYRGLDVLLEKDPTLVDTLYGDGVSYPPVLAKIALSKFNKSNKEAETLVDKAIKGYGDHVPANVLALAGGVKYLLGKWKESADDFTKALVAYGDNVRAQIWGNLGQAKNKLGENKEAEGYLTKAIEAYGSKVPVSVLGAMIHVKYCLRDYQTGNAYLIKTISAYGDEKKVQGGVWGQGAYIKWKLKEYDLAETYLQRALAAFERNIPIALYMVSAFIKMHFGRWEQAQEDYNRFYQIYREKSSVRTLEDLVEDFNEIISTCKGPIPAWVIEQADLLKKVLAKSQIE